MAQPLQGACRFGSPGCDRSLSSMDINAKWEVVDI